MGKINGVSNKSASTNTSANTSTSSSRLRKFDKLLIDQSSSTLLDEDDQIEYINELNKYNYAQYEKSKKSLIYLYIIQIIAIIALHIFKLHPKEVQSNTLLLLPQLLLLLSISINLIGTFKILELRKWKKWLMIVNILLMLQVTWIDLTNIKVYYYAILTWFDFAMPYLFRYWYELMDSAVEELGKLKYKYKNV